jgi:hypothetical protein
MPRAGTLDEDEEVSVGESLYERLLSEIQRERPSSGVPARKVMTESPRLRELATRAHYQPPPRRGLLGRLEGIRRSIVEPAEQAVEAERRPAARREELARLLERVGVELDAVVYWDGPERVETLLRRREALLFLLDKVPPPVKAPDMASVNASASAAVEAETVRLRDWCGLLEQERRLIKAEVEEIEQRGGDGVQERRLKQDMVDVGQAFEEAKENVRLAERPPLRLPTESPRRVAPEPLSPDRRIRDAPTSVASHWSLR